MAEDVWRDQRLLLLPDTAVPDDVVARTPEAYSPVVAVAAVAVGSSWFSENIYIPLTCCGACRYALYVNMADLLPKLGNVHV